MNHSESSAVGRHEAKIRLLRSERKTESKQLLQLKEAFRRKLRASASAAKPKAQASETDLRRLWKALRMRCDVAGDLASST